MRGTRRAVQTVVVALVAWAAVDNALTGAPSAEALCPMGGFETLWTYATTGRFVPHVHNASLVLAGAVVLLAVAGRGFFCGWLCPMGTIQEMLHTGGQAIVDRVPALRRARRRVRSFVAAHGVRRVDRVLRWGR